MAKDRNQEGRLNCNGKGRPNLELLPKEPCMPLRPFIILLSSFLKASAIASHCL